MARGAGRSPGIAVLEQFRKGIICILLLLGLTAMCPEGFAAPPFYEGKLVRVIVGTSPGGGYDTYARMIGRHLGKHIPGKPQVIVDNMPGGGGMIAANQLYKVAKPDGLTISHFNGGLFFTQAVTPDQPGMEFDAQKFQYIGAPVKESAVAAFNKASGITNIEKWRASPVAARMGGYGPGSFTPDITLNILKAALGLPIHLVTGYKGTAEIRLAIESGELAGSAFSWDSMKATWRKAIDAGDIVIILQLVPKPFPDLPNVPLALSLARTAEERRLIEVGIHSNGILARPFVLPPRTPAERVQMLRKAFQETLEDKEFLAEADKSKLGLDPVTGEELERSVLDLFKIDRALLNKLRDIISK